MMVDWDSLKLWGILPTEDPPNSGLGEPTKQWGRLLQGLPGIDREEFSYTAYYDEGVPRESVAASVDELSRQVSGAQHVQLSRSDHDEYRYGDLPISVRILGAGVPFPNAPAYEVWIPADAFLGAASDVRRNRIGQAIDLLASAHEQLEAVFSYAFAEVNVFPPEFHPDRASLFYSRPEHLYWCTIFSPALVDEIGDDQLLSTPGWRVEQLPDGSVLIAVSATPFDCSTALQAAKKHLGVNDQT